VSIPKRRVNGNQNEERWIYEIIILKLKNYNMSYHKKIIVDLDDTLSICKDRDFKNARPVQEVINKVNQFYDAGFEVVILTARGQLSCDGDYLAADNKYRVQIEVWLQSHKVQYNRLSFQKELAQFYIDDKNLNPMEFAGTKLERLKGGLSGADVYRIGNSVYKTAANVKEQMDWYQNATGRGIVVPEVESIVGETIRMKYIKELDVNDVTKAEMIIPNVLVTLNYFKNNHERANDNPHWKTYIERIQRHANKNDLELLLWFEILNTTASLKMGDTHSFNHGDFSMDNIILTENGITLIDPIYNETLFRSYILDAAKFAYSLRRKNLVAHLAYFQQEFCKEHNIPMELFIAAEASQWVRVLTYIKDELVREFYKEQITKINQEIRMICY
jgi:capsule biosynthesis phosphatase